MVDSEVVVAGVLVPLAIVWVAVLVIMALATTFMAGPPRVFTDDVTACIMARAMPRFDIFDDPRFLANARQLADGVLPAPTS